MYLGRVGVYHQPVESPSGLLGPLAALLLHQHMSLVDPVTICLDSFRSQILLRSKRVKSGAKRNFSPLPISKLMVLERNGIRIGDLASDLVTDQLFCWKFTVLDQGITLRI